MLPHFLLVYGKKNVLIGLGEVHVKCPSCEVHNWADMMVSSSYYHFFWLPIFPFDKEAHLTCTKCGLKRNGMGFSKRLLDNFDEIKSKYKHPWYTYTGAAIFLLLISLAVLTVGSNWNNKTP